VMKLNVYPYADPETNATSLY